MHAVRFRDPAGSIRNGHLDGDTVMFADRTYSRDAIDILPPVEPSKIVCVGRNYAKHADEMGNDPPDRPLLFLKGPNSLAGHNDTITVPAGKERIDYEGELAVIIGTQCKSVNRDDAEDVIAGYTCLNDLSNRDDQRQETNWVRGKAFDNAAPLGPSIAPVDALEPDASIQVRQNGSIVQDSSIDHLLFSIPTLIEEITTYMTLEPGDVIATGTPEGVGPIANGDTIEVEIEGVGTLRNEIVIP